MAGNSRDTEILESLSVLFIEMIVLLEEIRDNTTPDES